MASARGDANGLRSARAGSLKEGERIALAIIRAVGSGPSRLVLSFMLASAFLSMWISNTAAAIMMTAIGLAIIKHQEAEFGTERTHKLTVGLLIGIAYGCSIGGMATLVGTPPTDILSPRPARRDTLGGC